MKQVRGIGWFTGIVCGIVLAGNAAFAQKIVVGFIGDQGTFGAHNKGALKYAEATFDSKVIPTGNVAKEPLTNYAVLWWHDGDTDPTGLVDGAVKNALNDYLNAGGTLLLSAAAEKLANEIGVETGTPRIYGPGADAQAAGLTLIKDTVNHPVWKGFGLKEGDKIQVTSLGYPKSSDYHDTLYKEAKTVGDCWETGSDWKSRVGAFVEWKAGKGLVFGMGWRLAHFTDDNKNLADLQKLTTNVVTYLAENSAFLAVRPAGNAVATWGALKSR